MLIELWDIHGEAVAYIDHDQESIYLQDGSPVAWLSDSNLYTYRGKHLGWLWEGWIFGRDGKCVLFTEQARPGAVKPFRQPPGGRGDQNLRPHRDTREIPQKRRERSTLWSAQSARSFLTN
jgi:hypothetical protein